MGMIYSGETPVTKQSHNQGFRQSSHSKSNGQTQAEYITQKIRPSAGARYLDYIYPCIAYMCLVPQVCFSNMISHGYVKKPI